MSAMNSEISKSTENNRFDDGAKHIFVTLDFLLVCFREAHGNAVVLSVIDF